MVYVDSLFTAKKKNAEGFEWCHMIADTPQELHDFANTIGRKRCWFHKGHYDLTPSFRVKALEQGAIEIGTKELARKVRNHANDR